MSHSTDLSAYHDLWYCNSHMLRRLHSVGLYPVPQMAQSALFCWSSLRSLFACEYRVVWFRFIRYRYSGRTDKRWWLPNSYYCDTSGQWVVESNPLLLKDFEMLDIALSRLQYAGARRG